MQECVDEFDLQPVPNVLFTDKSFFRDLHVNQDKQAFLECLAVCHSVMREQGHFTASSPDELALVNFARFCGVEFLGVDEDNFINLSFLGEPKRYQVLDVLPFTSFRKRMSVVVKDDRGKLWIFCKGADNKLISRASAEQNPEFLDAATQNLDKFACEGLRTLLVSKRELSRGEFDKFKRDLLRVSRGANKSDSQLEKVQDQLERDLEILGATAIEDKLQEDVGVTLGFLRKAGIKVWVLTGDKVETARTIGLACNLLSPEVQTFEVTSSDANDLEVQLGHLHALLCPPRKRAKLDTNPFMSWTDPTRDLLDSGEKAAFSRSKYSLVISGDALVAISKKPPLLRQLARVSAKCESVLCCRVSPKQKAQIVNMMKEALPSSRTLAIGDGANDVNMIVEAHIGVGIRGLEGQQAARASDYSVGGFRHLRTLLGVYGRESYRRNSVLVLYTFWKNILMVLPQFWYALLAGNFSGMSLYEKFLFQFVNLVFTAYPIILYAILDAEVEPSVLLLHPKLYKPGPRKLHFNLHLFVFWMAKGLLHSFFVTLVVLVSDLEVDQTGRNSGFFSLGMTVFVYCVVVVNVNILVFSNSFYFLNIFCVLGSIVLAFGGLKVFSVFAGTVHFGNFETVLMADGFYSGLICCLVFITFFDYLLQIMQKMLFFEFVGVKFNIKGRQKRGRFEEGESKEGSIVTAPSSANI